MGRPIWRLLYECFNRSRRKSRPNLQRRARRLLLLRRLRKRPLLHKRARKAWLRLRLIKPMGLLVRQGWRTKANPL